MKNILEWLEYCRTVHGHSPVSLGGFGLVLASARATSTGKTNLKRLSPAPACPAYFQRGTTLFNNLAQCLHDPCAVLGERAAHNQSTTRQNRVPGTVRDLHYRGNSNAYIVRDSHHIGENLYCAGARYSAGEVACTISALYRDHYCTLVYFISCSFF